nr:phospholipase D1 ScoTox-betaI isoform X5 [Hemiscorpius lepturus]
MRIGSYDNNSKRRYDRTIKTVALIAIVSTVVAEDNLDNDPLLRPIWNIGHMANSKYEITKFLELGANGVEADISFNDDGKALWTFHGWPCDCGRNCTMRENVDDYLDYVGDLTRPDSSSFLSHFTLIILDMKISHLSNVAKNSAGKDIAEKIVRHLWNGEGEMSQVWILFSIPSTEASEFVVGFKEEITKLGYEKYYHDKIGWDIWGYEDYDVIRETYKRLNVSDNVWLSSGNTNCLYRFHRSLSRAGKAVKKRDSRESKWKFAKKVYVWTIDEEELLGNAISLKVDGIVTNRPDTLHGLLTTTEFAYLGRLANRLDDPWKKWKSPYK